mgnify:CR=1 FL=1
MKKLLYLFSAVALTLTSCSSDDDSTSSSNSGLLTKIIETFEDNSTLTTEFQYSGTKLVRITDDEGRFDYTYTNDLITEIKYYESNTLLQTETFQYDTNGRVTTYIIVDNIDTDWGNKETYTYNTNGSVSVNYYSGDAFSQTTLDRTGTITFLNGEINQISFSDGKTITYSYDNKNNPFKNVTGFDKINFCNQEGTGVLHNIIQEDDSTDLDDISTTYTYNSNDYPITSTETGFEVTTAQYFYN